MVFGGIYMKSSSRQPRTSFPGAAQPSIDASVALGDTTPENPEKPAKRVLDPIERILEVLFGLIMVMTVTCSFSVAGSGHADVRNMLIGALGCNLAWGTIDGVMYLMSCFSARGRSILALRAARAAVDPVLARGVIADWMPPLFASVLSPSQFEQMRLQLMELPEPPSRPHLVKDDWLGALGVFLLVLLATLPVVLPFVFFRQPMLALRISNVVAVAMLFLTGYAFGRQAGFHPWGMALTMVLVGGAMVGLTIALGG